MLFDFSSQATAVSRFPITDNRPAPKLTDQQTVFSEIAVRVREAQAGCGAAQSALVRGYRHRVAGLVHKMMRDRSAVEDVVQTVMIRMIQRLPLLREPGVFESWLFRMARNEVLDTLRRAKCRPLAVTEDWDWRSLADTSDDQSYLEVKQAVEHVMQCLNEADRDLIRMVIAGHSYLAIAAKTGLTRSNVKIRLYRIRLILRPLLCQALGEKILRDAAASRPQC